MEAVAVFRKCRENTVPDRLYSRCLVSLGEIYASQNKDSQAEDVFKQAVAVCKNGPVCRCYGWSLIGLGRFYISRGRRREASVMADHAEKLCADYQYTLDPRSDPDILLDLAGLNRSLGDVSKEKNIYYGILAANPDKLSGGIQSIALEGLADLEMAQGRFRDAEHHYLQAIPLLGNTLKRKAALESLAAAYEKEGKPTEAAEARGKAETLKAPLP